MATSRTTSRPVATRPEQAAAAPPLRRTTPGRGLVGPQRPRHSLDLTSGAAALPLGDDGVLIGVDPAGEPALLGLFRESALGLVLVGGLWLGRLIALRAAAVGARVVVETGRPQAWQALAQAAGAEQPCVSVHGVGQIGAQGASATGPVLVIRDVGARPGRSRPAGAPWQTVLTLLPYLAPPAEPLLTCADLVAVQRISPQEAETAGRVLGLPDADVRALPALGGQESLWAAAGHRRRVVSRPTPTEAQLLGPARRVD